MASLDFLFGGQPPSTYLAPTTAETNLPQWYQDAQRGLITQASAIANEPYSPYSGPRVAGLDSLQQQAIGNAGTAGQAGASTLQQGADLAYNAGNTQFEPAQFQQFMSPYTNGLMDTIALRGQRNLSENILPQINDSFIGSGMPFGSRHEDITGRAVRDANESILGEQSKALQSSYDSAMSTYQNALQRQAQTGGILSGIGTGQTQNEVQAGGFQNLMGGVEQANQQQNLDTAYGDFQNQKNYPLQQLDVVNSILKGYSPYQSKTATTVAGSPNTTATYPGQTALGALSAFFGGK